MTGEAPEAIMPRDPDTRARLVAVSDAWWSSLTDAQKIGLWVAYDSRQVPPTSATGEPR